MRFPVLMLAIVLSAGCATPPAAPTARATVGDKSAAPLAPAVANRTTSAEKRVKVPAGYKAKTRDGQTIYCKKTARLGTRFETETCMTANEAVQLEAQAEADRQMFRKNQGVCSGSSCGGG